MHHYPVSVALLLFLTKAAMADPLESLCLGEFEEDTACSVVIGTQQITIKSNGQLTSSQSETLRLRMPKDFSLDRVSYMVHSNDAYVAFEITDGENGGAIVARITLDAFSLKWSRDLPAFNPSLLLLDERSIYVGAFGTIAKLDVRTGSIKWIHSHLYEPDTDVFNAFSKATKVGTNIVFTESYNPPSRHQKVREVVVNDSNGGILSK